MDFATLTTRTLTRAQDTGNHVFSEAEVKGYLNDAYMDVVAARPDWPFMETRRTQVTVTAGTGVVDLPTDVWSVGAAFNATDGFMLDPLDGRGEPRRHFPDDTSAGPPTLYRVLGSQIEVYPTPTTDTVLELDAFAPPAELSGDTDEPAFPRQHHRILVNGALAELYDDDGNHAAGDRHRARFEAGIHRLAMDLFAPRQEGYPQVIDNFYG